MGRTTSTSRIARPFSHPTSVYLPGAIPRDRLLVFLVFGYDTLDHPERLPLLMASLMRSLPSS